MAKRLGSHQAVYNLGGITLPDGAETGLFVDANGNLLASFGTALAGEDTTNDVIKVEQRFSNTYISTATTTTPKNAPGFLHTITVNGGTAGTIIVYDNTAGSGTIIASFDSTNAIATYTFDVAFGTGLTIVTGGNTKLSVSWR